MLLFRSLWSFILVLSYLIMVYRFSKFVGFGTPFSMLWDYMLSSVLHPRLWKIWLRMHVLTPFLVLQLILLLHRPCFKIYSSWRSSCSWIDLSYARAFVVYYSSDQCLIFLLYDLIRNSKFQWSYVCIGMISIRLSNQWMTRILIIFSSILRCIIHYDKIMTIMGKQNACVKLIITHYVIMRKTNELVQTTKPHTHSSTGIKGRMPYWGAKAKAKAKLKLKMAM